MRIDIRNVLPSCEVLISRVIAAFELNLYIPISKLDQNMDIAHRMDAYARISIAPSQASETRQSSSVFGSREARTNNRSKSFEFERFLVLVCCKTFLKGMFLSGRAKNQKNSNVFIVLDEFVLKCRGFSGAIVCTNFRSR